MIRRRSAIGLLLGAAAAWPYAACGQALPLIGFLNGQIAAGFTHLLAAFRAGLVEAGLVEGRNVAIEYRWADGDRERMRPLADELLRLPLAVLVATGGAHLAAKVASNSVPIVCTFGGDPVKSALVQSISRPGGNLTGVSVNATEVEAKRLELLHELLPRTAAIAILIDPRFPEHEEQVDVVGQTARALGREFRIIHASTDAEIDSAFAKLGEMSVGGVVATGTPFFNSRRERFVGLAARHHLPMVHESREFTLAGGLMSYGTNIPDVYRQIGLYTARVLKGEKPADLPILFPTKFDVALNLKTARALGIEVPTSILLRANEVIE